VADLQSGSSGAGGAGAQQQWQQRQRQQQQQQQQPSPPLPPHSSLDVDPVPAMRSLLRAVEPYVELGEGGEGWAVLRGVLGACAPRGVLSGPELALALSRWAPGAFPMGVHAAWPFVVSMGVEKDREIDVVDFAHGLEALGRDA
jgi:hypothetical protein